MHTALREAHEEIGLDPASVTPLGALQPTLTIVTGYDYLRAGLSHMTRPARPPASARGLSREA